MRLKKGSLSNCIEFSIVEDVTMTGKIASSNETFFLQCIFYSRNVMDLCSNNIPYTQKYFIHFISITFYFCNTFRCYKLYPLALSETRKSHKSDYLPYIKMQHVGSEIFTVTEIERKNFVVKLNTTRFSILFYICKKFPIFCNFE